MKNILFIMNNTPYSNNHSFELLDSAMVSAIFELKVSLLYKDEGVWNLISKQNGGLTNTKTYSKVVSGLSVYEIDNVYFCQQSVLDRQISATDLAPNANPLSLLEQKQLIADQDIVMTGPK